MPLPMIPGGYTAPSGPDVPEQIAKVEAASGGTLPASMTLALAQSTLEERRLLRAARMLASYFDLDPSWFLQPYNQNPGWVPIDGFADPVTGERLSLASARRFLRPHEPEVISRMLTQIAGTPTLVPATLPPSGFRLFPMPVSGPPTAVAPPNAGRIAHMVRALAPIAGERTPFAAALSFAMQAADERVNPEAFEANLSITARLRGLDPLLAAEIAKRATVAGVTFRGPGDVASFVAPGAAAGIEAGKHYASPAEVAAKQAQVAAAAAAGKPIPATLEEMGGIPIEAGLGQEIVAGLTMSGNFLKSLTDAQDNYIAASKQIEHQVTIPFTDSWVGKKIGAFLQWDWKEFEAILRPIVGGVQLVGSPIESLAHALHVPGATQPGAGYGDIVQQTWRDYKEIAWGHETLAEQLKNEMGVPPWLTSVGELAAGFFLDPMQVGFNWLSAARAARTTFGLAEAGRASERAGMVDDFLHSPVARLGRARGKTIGEYLLGEADLAADPERFYGRAVRSFRARYETEGIQPLVAERIWRFAKASRKLNLTEAQRLEGVDSVLMAALGITPKPGSLAAEIATHAEALNVRTPRQLPLLLEDGTRYIAPTERLTKDASAAIGALDDAYGDLAAGRYRMVEIPHLGSPVTRMEIALATSGAADSQFGKTLRATFQYLPKVKGLRYQINLETGTEAVRDFERGLRGYESFSSEELAQARLQFSSALEGSNPFREQLATKIVQNWEHDALERINLRYGLDQEMSDRIISEIESRRAYRPPEKAFAAFKEGSTESVERLPILSRTQQSNWVQMIDPYTYRQGIAETIGTWRKWRAAHYAAFGRAAPGARQVRIPLRKFLDRSMDIVVRDLFLSWFKPLVVMRPAYVLRVPGGEEQLRFLATLGFSRRVASGNLLSRVFGEGGIEGARMTVDTPELKGLIEGPGQVQFLRAADLADEPLFNQSMSFYAGASPTPVDRLMQDALSPGRWGAISRDQPGFTDWWYNTLAHQFGLDPLGRRYLDDIAHGLDEETSFHQAVHWLTTPGDGMAEAKALMGGPYTRESLEVQVQKGVAYAHDLTSGHPDLAAAAREQTLTPEMLNAVPQADRPLLVHGPLTDASLLSKAGPAKRFVNWWGKWILQEPTNRLTRQPFGKSWEARIYNSLVETARESGMVLTPKMLEGFRSTSRDFAVNQVRRIMFDFTRQGRLDQLTRHVLMFVQPALEEPVAWARVIRQNPASVWHIVRMGRAAMESGFIKTDPDTGELVIPLSWWAGAAPLLAASGIGRMGEGPGGGWSLSAPLTSLNFFMQNTFPIPTGHLAGDVPILFPGWNPEALWGLQRFLTASNLRADVKARLSSWLFAYGGLDVSTPEAAVGSLVPSYLRHFLEAAFPEWLSNETNLQQTHFMQLQQAMGLKPDTAMAARQSREFSFLRGVFALIFPAAPGIDFPTQDLNDEFQALVEKTGDYSKAREEFVGTWNPDTGQYEGGLHPGLDLITLGRTMWAQDNTSPVRITSTAAVNQLLNTKGAKQFAHDHPLWVWAIIPSELQTGAFDAGAFFSQIASGQVVPLTPSQYETKAQVQRGWDAYFALREGHLAWQEAHPSLGERDPPYEEETLDYAEALSLVKETNPEWAKEFNTFELQGVDPKVMAESRRLASDKLFSQTDAGTGLAAYFDLRDPIEAELAKLGIHSINTIAADNAGLTKRYNAGLKDITEAHPDFATAYRLFFEGDLQHVLTTGEKAVNRLPEGVWDTTQIPWWTRYEELRAAPNMAQLEDPRNQTYNDLRTYMNRAYSEFSKAENPLILQWNLKDPNYQATSALSLVSRPYEWLSIFEKTFLLHDATNNATEKLWTQYANTRVAISVRGKIDPNFSTGQAYHALSAWVAANAVANKTFAAQVAAASTWGYSLSKVIEDPKLAQAMFGTELGSESRSYWGAFLDGLGQIQHVVDAAKLGGSYDPQAKVAYNVLRGKLVEYVNELRDSSPLFKAQWDYLEEASGPDPAISYFMPVFGEYYGPLTGYPGD